MLEATLDADAVVGHVDLTFSVRNAGDEPVTLAFPDSQRAEFVVSQEGEEVWRWSRGQLFAQAVDDRTLAPGETYSFEAAWEKADPGEYRVVGELAATDVDLRAEKKLTVPATE